MPTATPEPRYDYRNAHAAVAKMGAYHDQKLRDAAPAMLALLAQSLPLLEALHHEVVSRGISDGKRTAQHLLEARTLLATLDRG